jgi:hypothetical protein
MKFNKKLPALLLIIFLAANLSAQINNCIFNKSFPVKKGTTLKLVNKYGDINCLTGKDDSLSVCATVTIIQDSETLLSNNMKFININFEKLNDTIRISTQYDKKFFTETAREGRKSFSVDYLIKMPAYIDLKIGDEFGNILLEEVSGIVNIRLSQGQLGAKKLTRGNVNPVSTIIVDHGKISIDELNWMTLSVFNCSSVIIGKAQALKMNSAISKIKIEEISSLISNSKSDNYSINSINNLLSESTYSVFEIGKLNGQLKSKGTYGSINILDMYSGFNYIDIVSDQTQISFTLRQNTSFIADIVATDASVQFPPVKYQGLKRADSGYSTTISGTAGANKETKSLIKIRATSGKVSFH